jgi:hypothetical protein
MSSARVVCVVALCVVGGVTGCGPDRTAAKDREAVTAHASASSAPSDSAASARASAERARDEEKRRELEAQLGIDPPDADPTGPVLAPTEANVQSLLAGVPALSALAVRSTDRGESFDRHLPDRLKPTAPARDPKRQAGSRCDPRDPLCDE